MSEGGSSPGGALSGGAPGEPGSAGEAGSSARAGHGAGGAVSVPGCAETCGPNGACTASAGTTTCDCHPGFVTEGSTCRLPVACHELHQADPALPSGAYTLRPSLASGDVVSYCEMSAEGADDNSNLVLRSSIECGFSPVDLSPLFCDSCNGEGACAAPVVVFGDDDTSCGASQHFAISGALSHSEGWYNCAGSPQATIVEGQRHYPDNFRVWIR